jgi:hypothetical protein
MTYRITSASSSYTDSAGNVWESDRYYSGGQQASTDSSIANTSADPLYQNERYGNFTYEFPEPNGTYNVTLKFAEIYWTAEGNRVFNVRLEGQQVLSNFDIFAEAGGANRAIDKVFQATVSDGSLSLQFQTVVDNAKIGSIEIVPASGPVPSPSPTQTATPSPSPKPSPTQTSAPGSRDPLKQPFASSSIWNMPIGSNAKYSAANVSMPGNLGADEDILILTPSAPLTQVDSNQAGWDGPQMNRCDFRTYPNKVTSLKVPVPTNFVLDNSLPGMEGTPNNSGAVLGADGRTIYQMQPLQRCSVGGPLTYLTSALWPNVDIYGDGTYGSHGGSGLSAIGGTIRLGELAPGNSPIVNGVADVMRHALKFEFKGGLFGKFGNGPFWPANLDDGAQEGLLLALLPSFDYNSLKTAPARSIAWTLINYGAYIIDDTAWDAMSISTELSTTTNDGKIHRVVDEFQQNWGFSFNQSGTGSAWAQDIAKIVTNLQVITNNSQNSVGGGGTPRQPLAPPISP